MGGQMWMRYDQQDDTIHSKFVSAKGELCVTAVRSNKDPIQPANQNQISGRSASSNVAKTSQSVVDLGSFEGGAVDVARDLGSIQGGPLEDLWTSHLSTKDTRDGERGMLCGLFFF